MGFWLLCIALLLQRVSGAPAETQGNLEITSYRVQALVMSRYVITTISCQVLNPSEMSQEVLFSVMLPKKAFISNLTIQTAGKNYSSDVREKEEARRTYEKAIKKGDNAAIIHQKERETSRFRIDINVAANDEVTFFLSYEELLKRNKGNYTLRINIHPNYPIRDVSVEVTIKETRAISSLEVVKVPGGDKFRSAVKEWRQGLETAFVHFKPDPQTLSETEPLHGQLVLRYDLERALDAGDVQIDDGYFVHFFAPSEMKFTAKKITFLIDTSGSMSGNKIIQMRSAMQTILKDLHEDDSFSIVEFDSSSTHHITSKVTRESVLKASRIVKTMVASGGTNIDGGLEDALASFASAENDTEVVAKILVLLTDGDATEGVTSTPDILTNAKERNLGDVSIFCLGFGYGADFDLLERISLQNGGQTRMIYEDHDAAEQLTDFYQSLASPLLLDVQFSYNEDVVILDSLTPSHFYNYFDGSELVVSGQLNNEIYSDINANITGKGIDGVRTLSVNKGSTVAPPDEQLLQQIQFGKTSFMSRLWAFLKLQDFLNQEKAAMNKEDKAVAKRKALEIALKYHFVTPLTSLIVVQPDSEQCKDYDDEDDQDCTSPSPPPPPSDPTKHSNKNNKLQNTKLRKKQGSHRASSKDGIQPFMKSDNEALQKRPPIVVYDTMGTVPGRKYDAGSGWNNIFHSSSGSSTLFINFHLLFFLYSLHFVKSKYLP